MRRSILISALLCLLVAQAANAQFGLDKLKKGTDSVKKGSDKVEAEKKKYVIEEQDEIAIGEQISTKIRAKYGVAQDPKVHKYVALVGTVLAKKSTRPNLPWQFIVLDTDGVNAFAAPGGYIHITRGALAQIKSESELAGVLGHEIAHVTRKHTIKAIEEDRGIQTGMDLSGANKVDAINKLSEKGFELVFAGYGRIQEIESDTDGPPLVAQAGYAPNGLPQFLRTLEARNKDSQQKQGLFASHPEMEERLKKLDAEIADIKTGTATLEARYTTNIKIPSVPIGALAVNDDPSAQASAQPAAKPEEKKEEKKSRFSLGSLKNPLASNNSDSKQSASVTGSGGSRGVDRERLAKGGSNPTKVPVTITDAELASFIKDGKLTA
jgi:predicted Zn-dependent protease